MPLPDILPLFPLPNVVLFPQALLPLHVFEPRYRQMVKDVSASHELVGMVLLRPGFERDLPGVDDSYRVGCAGRLISVNTLPDGRSNILLQGVREFVVREARFDRPYRTGAVEWMSPCPSGLRLDEELRRRLVGAIRLFTGRENENDLRILDDPTMSDEMIVNLFAFALDLPCAEKQSLLETGDVVLRADRLVETLEFHVLERRFSPAAETSKPRVQ